MLFLDHRNPVETFKHTIRAKHPGLNALKSGKGAVSLYPCHCLPMAVQISVKRDLRSESVNKHPCVGNCPRDLLLTPFRIRRLFPQMCPGERLKTERLRMHQKKMDPNNHFKDSILKHTHWPVGTSHMYILRVLEERGLDDG